MAGHDWKPDPERRQWTCLNCGTSVPGCRDKSQREPWPARAEPEDDCHQATVDAVHNL